MDNVASQIHSSEYGVHKFAFAFFHVFRMTFAEPCPVDTNLHEGSTGLCVVMGIGSHITCGNRSNTLPTLHSAHISPNACPFASRCGQGVFCPRNAGVPTWMGQSSSDIRPSTEQRMFTSAAWETWEVGRRLLTIYKVRLVHTTSHAK